MQTAIVHPGTTAYAPLVQAYLATRQIHKLPPGKPVPTEVFIDRFKLSVEQRLRLWRAGG